jgi:hypothetical protein
MTASQRRDWIADLVMGMCDAEREPVLVKLVVDHTTRELGVVERVARRDLAHVVQRGSLIRPTHETVWPRLAILPAVRVTRHRHVYVPS